MSYRAIGGERGGTRGERREWVRWGWEERMGGGAVMALDDLMRRGYTFVTVNDLLADRGIAIQSGKVYRQAAQGGK